MWVSPMGRINVVVNDALDQRVRVEIAKRYGGKKGDLTKAVEEALRLWVDRPLVAKLKGDATDRRLPPSERESALRLLAKVGDGALDALLEVADTAHLTQAERDAARKEIEGILRSRRGRTSAPT